MHYYYMYMIDLILGNQQSSYQVDESSKRRSSQYVSHTKYRFEFKLLFNFFCFSKFCSSISVDAGLTETIDATVEV